MFTVYNNGIVDYKGSPDNLYNVKNINEITNIRFDPQEKSFTDFKNKQERQNNKRQEEQFLSSYKKMSQINQPNNQFYFVKDIMIQDVLYIDDSHTVKEAYELLKDKKIEQIPVTTIDKKIIG